MRLLIALALLIVIAGCVEPVQKLGCCLKVNATSATNPGCVLYNTSDFQEYDEYFAGTESCDNQTGCNVSIAGSYHLIPICSEADLVPCINQDCTAMVCGDYNFKPRISPAIQGISDSEGSTPPDLDEEGVALQFYKAQCRFLPMDAQLRQVMKTSRSQINVFRMGVGGSFDEYDQYKNYFPISDKFCNLNPSLEPDDLRVDRYMNYLRSDLTAYNNPGADITENCVDGTGDPPPVTFAESTAAKSSAPFFGSFSPVVPDAENYKFAHWGRNALWASHSGDSGGYYYYGGTPSFDQNRVFKKIDEQFYRRQLSIAHAATIYGTTSGFTTTRAPFECDQAANECYSGSCNTQIYNRGVMVMVPGIAEGGAEVVTDCNKMEDENGQSKVICPPTTDITISSTPGNPPTIDYGSVLVRPALIQTNDALASWPFSFNSLASDSSIFNTYWNSSTIFSYTAGGAERTVTHTFYETKYSLEERRYCEAEYPGEENDTTLTYCTDGYSESGFLPPAGGTVFFGKLKDDKVIDYKGNKIIGYTLSDPSSFTDLLLVESCGVNTSNSTETNDYIRVTLDGPDDQDWKDLVSAFTPYFEDRADALGKYGVTNCNSNIAATDAVVSSMPWVINYEKGLNDPFVFLGGGFDPDADYGDFNPEMIGKHMSSTPAQAYRVRNIYDQFMRDNNGTSACDLSRDVSYWWGGWYGSQYPVFYYNLAYSKYIYLWKYNASRGAIGQCAIDDSTMLPEMKTFGWCESCSTSTLAYQNITIYDEVYMPYLTAKIESPTATNFQSLCTADYRVDMSTWLNFQVTDNVTCVNPYISDIGEYRESIGYYGSPRTKPDATIIKERIGTYLKSGIMPVFDMTDSSNWDRTNPYAEDDSDFCLFFIGCEDGASSEYAQYEFERLFGNMGAVVTIIDHVSDPTDADAKIDEILERNTIMHERCFGCLTAVHIDNPTNNESFRETLKAALGHPLLADPRVGVDMVTFDYQVSDQFAGTGGPEALVDDMKSYSRIALLEKKKPTMIVGFNVENDDGVWSYANHENLFGAVIDQQDELVQAGLTGIIYSPARGSSGNDGKGLVNLDSAGLGTKSPKFCAFQAAMQQMSAIPPTALFTKAMAVDNATCVVCTSLDKVQGKCEPQSMGGPGLRCDNGLDCTMPDPVPGNLSADDFKCPESTLLNECTLCKDMPGDFICTKSYTNGSIHGPAEEPGLTGPMSDVASEIYMDVVAGLARPNKCCLETGSANTSIRYSFVKDVLQSPINKPVVFPRSGDQNVDCGFGADSGDLTDVANFCNIQTVPLKDFDINCTIIP